MSQSPIEKIIAESELRAVAQAIYDSQTALCAACGIETKCEASRRGYFFCPKCYKADARSRQEEEAWQAAARGEICGRSDFNLLDRLIDEFGKLRATI